MVKKSLKKDDFILSTAKSIKQLTNISLGVENDQLGGVMVLVRELHFHKQALEMQNQELLKTQQKLEETSLKYSYLFDFAPIAYFVIDKNSIISDLNRMGSKQLGVDKKLLIGKLFTDFLSNSNCKMNFGFHRKLVLKTENAQHFECEIKRTDGSAFIALIETIMVKDENKKFKHFLLMVTDISEQKQQNIKIENILTKERELSNFKSDFITLTSHEFRTPLAIIQTSVDLIEAYIPTQDKNKQFNQTQKIKRSVRRLNDIVGEFISVKEIESETTSNHPTNFNYISLIEELIEVASHEKGNRKINFSKINGSENIFLDKNLFKICFANILNNAIKYSVNSGIIKVQTEINSSKKRFIVTISNRGIGIPKADSHRIFEQFYRAKNVESIEGIGIGLSIAKKILTIMGGDIAFTSKENKQTTFVLTFKIP